MNDNKRSAFSKPQRQDPDETILASPGPAGKIYKPDEADTSNLPDKIKVDLSTALENSLLAAIGIAVFIAFFLYIQGTFGGKKSPPNPALLKYVPMMIGFAAAAFACWLGTDNYYIISVSKRKLLYHFKFLFTVKITPVADFEEINAIGVTGVRHTHKGNVWWMYKICAVKNNGEFIDLSDEAGPKKIDELNRKAKGMAVVAECLFAEGGERSKLSFEGGNSGLRVVSFEDEGAASFVESVKELRQIKLSLTFFVVVIIIITSFCIMMYVLLTPPM
jgi:hypothetical protein